MISDVASRGSRLVKDISEIKSSLKVDYICRPKKRPCLLKKKKSFFEVLPIIIKLLSYFLQKVCIYMMSFYTILYKDLQLPLSNTVFLLYCR